MSATAWFTALAALMLLAALACALVPLLRAGRRDRQRRAPFVLALILVLALPPAAFALYALVGAPAALQPADNDLDMRGATAQLQARLQQQPDDPQGWLLLAQAYVAMQRPANARDALGRFLKLRPDDADAMVAWVEADAQTRADHRIGDAARSMLEHALAQNPQQQRALWLLGVSDYQRGDFAQAAAHWNALLPLLAPGSKVEQAVRMQLALTQARAQGKSPAQAEALAQAASNGGTQTANDPAQAATAAAQPVALTVTVTLDPKLAARIGPGDMLFVFARALDGPPMPLAVARMQASALPMRVTLTDAMAMAPQLKLSMFPRVQVSARISKSGNALPQTGDLEAAPVQTATAAHTPIALTIDRVD